MWEHRELKRHREKAAKSREEGWKSPILVLDSRFRVGSHPCRGCMEKQPLLHPRLPTAHPLFPLSWEMAPNILEPHSSHIFQGISRAGFWEESLLIHLASLIKSFQEIHSAAGLELHKGWFFLSPLALASPVLFAASGCTIPLHGCPLGWLPQGEYR